MKLTIGEYCLFNLKSKISLLDDNGYCLFEKSINNTHELKLFKLFDFYVEVFSEIKDKRILKIEPIKCNQWLDFYSANSHEKNHLTNQIVP
jgi:hypothetical protein